MVNSSPQTAQLTAFARTIFLFRAYSASNPR